MPHATLRSQTVVPVRVLSPAWGSRRQTSPSVRRSPPTQAKIWRTTRASSGRSSSRACPPLIFGHLAVPIGRATPHIHGPAVCRMPLTTPVASDDLRAPILRKPAVYLREHVIFGPAPHDTT